MVDLPLHPQKLIEQHPVARVIWEASAGSYPTRGEVDALELGGAPSKALTDAVNQMRRLRDSGENGQARREFEPALAKVFVALPAAQRDPEFYIDTSDEPTDPAGLADRIRPY